MTRSRRLRWVIPLLVGVDCLVAAAGLGLALHGTAGEVALDRASNRVVGPPSPVSGPVAIRLAELGDRGVVALALAVVAVLAASRTRSLRPALAVAVAGASAQLLVLVGKRMVDRTLFTTGSSYPSGHVAGAVTVSVLALLAARAERRRIRVAVAALAGLLPLGTALGALWTQSHAMTDVLGGALVGAGVALVAWSALVPPAPTTGVGCPGDPSVLDGGAARGIR